MHPGRRKCHRSALDWRLTPVVGVDMLPAAAGTTGGGEYRGHRSCNDGALAQTHHLAALARRRMRAAQRRWTPWGRCEIQEVIRRVQTRDESAERECGGLRCFKHCPDCRRSAGSMNDEPCRSTVKNLVPSKRVARRRIGATGCVRSPTSSSMSLRINRDAEGMSLPRPGEWADVTDEVVASLPPSLLGKTPLPVGTADA